MSRPVNLTGRVNRLLSVNKDIGKLASSHLLALGQPIHAASMAVYLASDEAEIATGQISPSAAELRYTEHRDKNIESGASLWGGEDAACQACCLRPGVGLAAGLMLGEPAAAQKSGGILRSYNSSNPPSASILEEATIATAMSFSGIFNNLVIFDQSKPRNASTPGGSRSPMR
jgi:hypothetical protein